MDSSSTDTVIYFCSTPIIKVHKKGPVERLMGEEVVPPSHDPITNVESKDVVISKEEPISARLYIPKKIIDSDPNKRLPLIVYFHGGAFCVSTPFSPDYHNFLNSLVSKANAIGVSVNYRNAPEHPVPIAHEDSWHAVKWVGSHFGGDGPDGWLNRHADFGNMFFAGDSAGANLANYSGIRVGSEGLPGLKLGGVVLMHPYFWGVERIGNEVNRIEDAATVDVMWRFACPRTSGSDDPLINPGKDPDLGRMGCGRVLVCVAGKDLLRDRGMYYKELLEKSGWSGVVEVFETKDVDHVFHIMYKPNSEEALALLNKVVSFIKQD